MKNKDQRVGVFIDIQNLYHSAKNIYNARVNFKELVKHMLGGRKLIRAMAYVVKTEATLGEASFFEALTRSGIELRSKDIQIYPSGAKKADWDVGMAVDAIRMADFLDVIVLITGDGDFIPLVEYLQAGRGRLVEVAGFSRSSSTKLKEVADEFISIEEVPRALMKTGGIRKRISQKLEEQE
jgi:uncharacterized LabA/DUF88 family protein